MKKLKFFLLGIAALISYCSQGQVSTEKDDILKARDLANQGKVAEASGVYTDLMKKYPDNKEAVQGWLMLNMERSPTGEEDAIKQLEELEKTYPDNTAILFFKAFIQTEYEHYDDAIKSADKLIELKPGDALNWLLKGQVLEAIGKNDDALNVYAKSIELDPNNSDSWQIRAGLLVKTNRFDEAIESYTKAIQITPAQPAFIYNRGCAYCLKGDKANALADLQKAISMNPQFKTYVRQDQDFKSLWEDADFKAIVSQ